MAKRITYQIGGMECPNCAMILERLEDKLPGVLLAEASYHKARLVVEYDEGLLDEARLAEAIRRLGYQPTPRPEG
jgi:Cu+-exporting ATPase